MDRPIVTLSDGKIQGIALKSILGKKYLAFRGIPYAQPPLGELRFKEPQPPLKWSGIRDASDFAGSMPMQKETYGQPPFGVIGNEDCLYLNVYTNASDRKRPVMVYIYGGRFEEGNGNYLYKEDYFVSMDIVLVVINYRLGPLGFLNLGHEVASGNQGLRDVISALQWVQRNIKVFGGDPNNVTIFGNSAGGIISHLFTLIPMAKGLFHKAILQSGTIFMVKSLLKQTETKNGFKIASLLGMDSKDPEEVIEFLRNVPAEKLIELQGSVVPQKERMISGEQEYGPVYDAAYTKNPIIPIPIVELLQKDTNIPIIIGHNANESLLDFMGSYDDDSIFKFYNDNIDNLIKNALLLKDHEKFNDIMEDVNKLYLKNEPITKENARNLVNLMTDLCIAINQKTVDIRNKFTKAPTYVYLYSYEGNEPTFYQYDQGPQPLKGVAHADELSYMFYFDYMKFHKDENNKIPPEGTKDRLTIERFIKMWYNFALTGNPTSQTDDKCITTVWKPSNQDNLYYLDFGEELTLRDEKETDKGFIFKKFRDLFSLNLNF